MTKKVRKKSKPKLKSPSFLMPALVLLTVLAVGSYVTGTQLEEHDNFCASCHTQPEDNFYTRSLQSTPTDLATFHAEKGVLCIECHAGKGLIGRSLGLAAGAQDLVVFYSGHYPQPAKLEDPLPDANCTRCHAEALTRRDFNNHFHLLLSQWRSIDPQQAARCVTCHTSHTTSGAATDMFLIQDPVVLVCQKCHMESGQG